MSSYFSAGTTSSDRTTQRYLEINNCGYCENTNIFRPNGRRDYQLIYIKTGQLLVEADGQKQFFPAGNVYLYRPGTPQHYRIDDPKTSFYWVHFTGSAVEEMLRTVPDGCIFTGELPQFERFCRSFCANYRLSRNFSSLHYEGELISLFAAIAQCCNQETVKMQNYEKINEALLAINRSTTPHLSNEELAKLCNLNKYYFIKLFKNATGMPPQQYYAMLTVEKGKALLETTDYSVAEISTLCGVDDSFYFSRLFKKHTGLSPAAYRRHP